ncbi:TIGR01777 family protein [bacterium]|nr:TIGR01777 family protein [bacterium]
MPKCSYCMGGPFVGRSGPKHTPRRSAGKPGRPPVDRSGSGRYRGRSRGGEMDVLMTGGTGLIGQTLIPLLLERGDRVTVVTRDANRVRQTLPTGAEPLEADPAVVGPWLDHATRADAIVNLVGESVATGFWTRGKKRRLRRSRLRPTSHLADVLRDRDPERPAVLVSASATGYYGDGGEQALGEAAEPGQDYLAMLCYEWERNAQRAAGPGCRVAMTRFGLVLAREGGALAAMRPAFERGLGGRLGSGRQYWPWVHIQDVARAILFVIDTPGIAGPVNVTAPNPAQQREFARLLGEALDRPTRLPAPAWALRLVLGQKAAILLASQRAVPNRLKTSGFTFEHVELERALDDLIGPR